MEDRKEIIRQIRKIDITTSRRVQGLEIGRHTSVFRGQGVEFAELREYVPGDDIRSIDWKVSARLSRPFVKQFTEERDQTFCFVLDVSGSGSFGSSVTKRRKAIEIVASLMFAAVRSNDRIGLALVSDRMETFVRAKKGRRHVVRLLNTIIDHQPVSRKTDLAAAVRLLAHALKRQSSVILISDFDSPPFARDLAILRAHHEVIALRIMDPVERDLPDVGYITLEDVETGEQILINTSDAGFRERYRALVAESEEKLDHELAKSGTASLSLVTSEPYDVPLKQFFKGIPGRRRAYGRIL